MATIKLEPPQAPMWHLTITEDERDYILAAFDFARAYLNSRTQTAPVSPQWPNQAGHYLNAIGMIEQVMASVSDEEWRNG